MPNLPNLIPVEAVQERDIDLLFLEEVISNVNFRDWLLDQFNQKPDSYAFLGAWHSLSQVGLGESDLAFKISADDTVTLYLIENKINANFQDDQALRYRRRGEKRRKEGECDQFFTVLFAPERYMIGNEDFDFLLSYESVRDWFGRQDVLGERAKYKAELLEIAIERQRRGYNAIIDEAATSFWWTYYKYAQENYPHLRMKKPKAGVPKTSDFIIFKPAIPGLKRADQIMHKGYGAVDLQLAGQADKLPKLIDKYESTLNPDMAIVQANKSASFRINAEPFDVTKPFEEQLEIVKKGLEDADRLYRWGKKHLK